MSTAGRMRLPRACPVLASLTTTLLIRSITRAIAVVVMYVAVNLWQRFGALIKCVVNALKALIASFHFHFDFTHANVDFDLWRVVSGEWRSAVKA